MDALFFSNPRVLFSSYPLCSFRPCIPISLKSEIHGGGIRLSCQTRRLHRIRRSGRSCPLIIRAFSYDTSLLVTAAFVIANFAAIRLVYLNHATSKKDVTKLSHSSDTNELEGRTFSKQDQGVMKKINFDNWIEVFVHLYKEITVRIGETSEDAEYSDDGQIMDTNEKLLHSSAFKLSAEPFDQVHSTSIQNAFSLIKDKCCNALLSMSDIVDMVDPECSVNNKPKLFGGHLRENAVIRSDLHLIGAEKVSKDKCRKNSIVFGHSDDSKGLRTSSINAFSKCITGDIFYSFYEGKQLALRAVAPVRAESAVLLRPQLQEHNRNFPLSVPQSLKGVEPSKHLYRDTGKLHVGCFKDLSRIKRINYFESRRLPRDPMLSNNQVIEGDMHRSLQPIEIDAKEKKYPSEYLSTYNHLLRAGRLTDIIKLLESMENKGVLDMDKVYHSRFYEACRSKKAVKEAFLFTKLIKKPMLSTFNMLLSVCASSQNSEVPFEVLNLVKEAGLKADCKLYTTLISTFAKAGKVDTMFEVFHEMVNAGVEPNVHTYGALIDGCARAGQVAKAFGAYGIMRSKNVKPDRIIFNALITACGESGAVDRAFDVLAEMRAEVQPIDPDHVTVGALIRTCSRAGQIHRAREVYKMMQEYNIKGTPEVYTIAVNSCSEAADLEFAFNVYNDMKRNGVVADEMFLSALIDIAGHAGKADVAFKILQDAKIHGLRVGDLVYSSVFGACSKAKSWQKAIDLYEDLKLIKWQPTVSALNALITSLCNGDQLGKSVDVLAELKEVGVCPNEVTYSILLVACEKNGELELSFELFAQARRNGVLPNLVMCKCLIGLCLRRFQKAVASGEPICSANFGKPQIENKWTSWALMVYREFIASGVVPSMEVFSQVLGCLQLPRDTSYRNSLTQNLGMNGDSLRRSNLYSLVDGFGEYDPRSFSLLEEAASLGIIQCVSLKESPVIIDARKLQIHAAEVYILTVLKGLKYRFAAGAKMPNIIILLPVEKSQIREKTISLSGRVGLAVGSMLRRLGLYFQGRESLGKIRISGIIVRRWFQPKLTKLPSQFVGKPFALGSSPTYLYKEITNQQRNIRNNSLSLE